MLIEMFRTFLFSKKKLILGSVDRNCIKCIFPFQTINWNIDNVQTIIWLLFS